MGTLLLLKCMIENKVKKYMEEEGWLIECESPFEIRNSDGSFASGFAAKIVYDYYRDELSCSEEFGK